MILDLLDKHPDRIRLRSIDKKTRKIMEELQDVVYDNLPLYFNHCKHQGHDEKKCRVLLGKTNNNSNVEEEGVEEDDHPIEKLQGDTRNFLNAKKQQNLKLDTSTEKLFDVGTGAASHVLKAGSRKSLSAKVCVGRGMSQNATSDGVVVTGVNKAVNFVPNVTIVQIEAGQITEKTTTTEKTVQTSRTGTIGVVQSVPVGGFGQGLFGIKLLLVLMLVLKMLQFQLKLGESMGV